MKNKYLYYRRKLDYLIEYIDTHHPHDLIHLSRKKLNLDMLGDTNNIMDSWLSNIYYNPTGLWVSCGSSWLKFLKKNNMYYSSWVKCKYIYCVRLNAQVVPFEDLSKKSKKKKPRDILHISQIKELIDFHCHYATYKRAEGYKIDWMKVVKDYSGLIICPYLGEKIWKREKKELIDSFYLAPNNEKYILDALQKNIMKYPSLYLEWYRHWEASTGVVWKMDSIQSILPLFEFQYEKG